MSATEIRHIRYFNVTVTLYGEEQRDVPGGRHALRAGGLIFQVDACDGKLIPDDLITVPGRTIRRDGTLGAEATRVLWLAAHPWLAAHVGAAVEQIARDWPGLVAP